MQMTPYQFIIRLPTESTLTASTDNEINPQNVTITSVRYNVGL